MRTAAGLVAVALLGGAGGGGLAVRAAHGDGSGQAAASPAAPAAAPAAEPVCRPADLAVSFDDARAAAGQGVAVFAIQNRSGQPCVANGSPSLDLVDANGRPIAASSPSSPASSSAVTVPPDGAAYFGVHWTGVCGNQAGPELASAVRVLLPGSSEPAIVSGATLGSCGNQSVRVTPIAAQRTALVP